MLQLRQLYTHVGLTNCIQELPYALGTVANRTDESGHHGCTREVMWVTNSLFLKLFPSLAVASVTFGAGSLSPTPARQYKKPLPSCIVHQSHPGSPAWPAVELAWVWLLGLLVLMLLVLALPGLTPGTALERKMGETKFLVDFGGIVSPKNAVFSCAGSDEDEFLVTAGVTQDEVEIVPIVGVVEVEKVQEVVGFVGVQGVHVVEFGIEGEVVEEVVVEKTVEEEMGLVSMVGFVEGEVVEK